MMCFFADLVFRINRPMYYKLRYFLIRRKIPNFSEPSNLSEWLLAKMLSPEFKRYSIYTDKIQVRSFVEGKGFGDSLPKIYDVWDSASDIDFSKLPKRFVLKTNHGCGNHIISLDKLSLNISLAVKSMNKLLKQRYSIREPQYANIAPKVYAEEFIDDRSGYLPVDYKFMCVSGKVVCILVCTDRQESYKLKVYDRTWNDISADFLIHSQSKRDICKPENLDHMINMAEVLSSDFEFVRVDLYDTGKKVYFGEMTFTPNSSLLKNFSIESLNFMYSKL